MYVTRESSRSRWAQSFWLFIIQHRSLPNQMPNSTRNSFLFDYSSCDSECCVSSSHHWVLKGTWVIVAYLYEWAKWDGSCKQAHVLLFLLLLFFKILLWCHNQRLPEHKVHSQTPAHNTGAELQTSRLHGNCSLRAWMVPLLLSFSGGIWSCVFVCMRVCSRTRASV